MSQGRRADIEVVVQWAVARSGRLPWDNARDQELSFDRGLTVRPKRRAPGSWALAEACAGLTYQGRPLKAVMHPGPDADRVLAAIRRLDPAAAATVLSCARAGIRPDCMLGIEPRRVAVVLSWRKGRRKGGHRPIVKMQWEPCAPEAICLARATYERWHAAMRVLSIALKGTLEAWEINGFAAPLRPWEEGAKENA
jgi:hypothetical protein